MSDPIAAGAVDMNQLTFLDEEPTEVPPRLADGEDVKVVRSYRISVELDRWLTSEAQVRAISNSELVRELLELGRATSERADRPISLADALRALSGLRPLGGAA